MASEAAGGWAKARSARAQQARSLEACVASLRSAHPITANRCGCAGPYEERRFARLGPTRACFGSGAIEDVDARNKCRHDEESAHPHAT